MPRSAILRQIFAVALVAVLLVSFIAVDPAALILTALSLGMGFVVRRAVRTHPPLAPRLLAASAALGNLSIALVNVYAFDYLVILLMAFLAFVTTALSLGAGSVWAASVPRGRLARAVVGLIVVGLGLLPLSMVFTLWPLRAAFALSRGSMERIADRLEAGGALTAPEWAGAYRIVEAVRDERSGNVALLIDANPAGKAGFVRVTDPRKSIGPLVGLDCDIPVGGHWRYQLEE